MKVVIQRVSKCSIISDGVKTAEIGWGLLVLIGIIDEDTKDDIDWLANKIVNLRIFPDQEGVMNKSVLEYGGDIVVVRCFSSFPHQCYGCRIQS